MYLAAFFDPYLSMAATDYLAPKRNLEGMGRIRRTSHRSLTIGESSNSKSWPSLDGIAYNGLKRERTWGLEVWDKSDAVDSSGQRVRVLVGRKTELSLEVYLLLLLLLLLLLCRELSLQRQLNTHSVRLGLLGLRRRLRQRVGLWK
jgi:hypothetical protein